MNYTGKRTFPVFKAYDEVTWAMNPEKGEITEPGPFTIDDPGIDDRGCACGGLFSVHNQPQCGEKPILVTVRCMDGSILSKDGSPFKLGSSWFKKL